jgi:hypothetical protein
LDILCSGVKFIVLYITPGDKGIVQCNSRWQVTVVKGNSKWGEEENVKTRTKTDTTGEQGEKQNNKTH